MSASTDNPYVMALESEMASMTQAMRRRSFAASTGSVPDELRRRMNEAISGARICLDAGRLDFAEQDLQKAARYCARLRKALRAQNNRSELRQTESE